MLVSSKNIDIWPSFKPNLAHMSMFRQVFFWQNSAIFRPIGLKCLFGSSRNYSLSVSYENSTDDAYKPFLFFGHFSRENGASNLSLKVGKVDCTFGSTVILKSCFDKFSWITPHLINYFYAFHVKWISFL